MITVRYAQLRDRDFWFRLDKHLPDNQYEKKIRDKQAYILLKNDDAIGVLRYNLFWDSIPFCTMVYIDSDYRGQDFGRKLIKYWEDDMKSQGYDMVLTSTQVDEEAQHFYRKLGYRDCGGIIMDIPNHRQPMEMFFVKSI